MKKNAERLQAALLRVDSFECSVPKKKRVLPTCIGLKEDVRMLSVYI